MNVEFSLDTKKDLSNASYASIPVSSKRLWSALEYTLSLICLMSRTDGFVDFLPSRCIVGEETNVVGTPLPTHQCE
jgi:hypothetical protein